MVLLSRRGARASDSPGPGEGIEEGSRVVVLSGRNFPSFGAGDQGRVLRVDQEALNCEVLFDGQGHPVPVALRHLKVQKGGVNGRVLAPTRLEEQPSDTRVPRKSSLSDRSNSASPRRSVSITEPVASPQPSSPREPPSGPRRSLDQRLRAAEMALDSPLTPAPGPAARPSSASSGWSLEERMGRLEQRLAQEAEARQMLSRQLQEAISFGQAQEARANALERQLQARPGGGVGAGASASAPTSPYSGNLAARRSAPLYLSAALPQSEASGPPALERPGPCPARPGPAGPVERPGPGPGPAGRGEERCVSCGTAMAPGSRFCIKCGREEPAERVPRRSLPNQNSSYIRGYRQPPASAQAPSSGPLHTGHVPSASVPASPVMSHAQLARAQVLSAGQALQPLPAGAVMPMEHECAYSPASHISNLSGIGGFTPPPAQILTPRLVLPQRPFY
ncbi:unnamed protein product [Effrenium voratum]|nr:unnamed protein product [Effrenium voratum]